MNHSRHRSIGKRSLLFFDHGICSLGEVERSVGDYPIKEVSSGLLVIEEGACFKTVEDTLVSSNQDARLFVDLDQTLNSLAVDRVESIEDFGRRTVQFGDLLWCQVFLEEQATATLV